MGHRVVFLDAFTETAFSGNPCAVLPEAAGLSDERMQRIAKEVNQPETSFVLPSALADFKVAYFTTRQRIPFAGHPTIATAFLLALDGAIRPAGPAGEKAPAGTSARAVVQFEFDIGVLPVEVHFTPQGQPVHVVMNQAAPVFGSRHEAAEVAPCLGLHEKQLLPGLPAQVVSTGVAFLVVPARDLESLKQVQMDRPRLRQLLSRAGAAGVFLFCLQGFDSGSDTHARLLDPDGTMEDPFTGSASGCMGAFIVRHGLKGPGVLHIEQGHLLGRPGHGRLEVRGSPDKIEAIRLSGPAVKTLEGTILT